MVEFSPLVVERWNLAPDIANEICERFAKGDSFFCLNDYVPTVIAACDTDVLREICDFLTEMTDLGSKRKRVIHAFEKAQLLNSELESRVKYCSNSAELDDMLLPLRPNPRSRAQVALKEGFGELADSILLQDIEDKSVEEIAAEFIAKKGSSESVEDSLSKVRDILTERFAYNDVVREMVRDFGYEDGFFEVIPKKGKEREYASYRGKTIPVQSLSPEESLSLLIAEDTKDIKLKHGVQLFMISELLRHHFITNPDSTSFDIICQAIDECWSRFLQEIAEDSVKKRLRASAEDWALRLAATDIRKMMAEKPEGTLIAVSMPTTKEAIIVAVGSAGNIVGATREKLKDDGRPFSLVRLRQFFQRYRPRTLFITPSDNVESLKDAVIRTTKETGDTIEPVLVPEDDTLKLLVKSNWITTHCADLDDDMKILYAVCISHTKPLSLVTQIGIRFFNIHPLLSKINPELSARLLERMIAIESLNKGIAITDVVDSPLKVIPGITETLLADIRKYASSNDVLVKSDILKVPGITDSQYRNIAGYILLPAAFNPLDRSTAHPDLYNWIESLASDLGNSVEVLCNEPERLRGIAFEDPIAKVFVEKKLIAQLMVGKLSSASAQAPKPRRRLPFSELVEDSVVSGRITNIAQFGVFVDINATCDGLVHVSQLADLFVESPEQVVHLNQQVYCRIVKVDPEKRRISLSMKNLGDKGLRVKPTVNQLSNLSEHFKNR
jgi:uncharacterized protein